MWEVSIFTKASAHLYALSTNHFELALNVHAFVRALWLPVNPQSHQNGESRIQLLRPPQWWDPNETLCTVQWELCLAERLAAHLPRPGIPVFQTKLCSPMMDRADARALFLCLQSICNYQFWVTLQTGCVGRELGAICTQGVGRL